MKRNKRRRFGIYDPEYKAYFSFYLNELGGVSFDKWGYKSKKDFLKNVMNKNYKVEKGKDNKYFSEVFNLTKKQFKVDNEIIGKKNSVKLLKSIISDLQFNVYEQKKLKRESKIFNELNKKEKKQMITEYLESHLNIKSIEEKFDRHRIEIKKQTKIYKEYPKKVFSSESRQNVQGVMTYGNKTSSMVFMGTTLFKYLKRDLKSIGMTGQFERFTMYVNSLDDEDDFYADLNKKDFTQQSRLEILLAKALAGFGYMEFKKRNVQITIKELL